MIVPSGDMAVCRRAHEVLEAYLGTCVGVALWDREAGVGGLFHALLAEPLMSGSVPAEPLRYASTGLPLFLEALEEKGAKPSRLEAAVAGGAIVGPGHDVHLDLQIGARTLERVELFLKATRIPVVLSETGGTFTCCLRLHCHNWTPEIIPVGTHFFRPEGPPNHCRPSRESLEKAIKDVKPIPQTAFKILALLRSETYQMGEISREIRLDQVLAAKVLALCNSPVYGAPEKIDSLDRALVFLGEKRILQMALQVFLSGVFPSRVGGYSLCKGGLFQHAVSTALGAEFIARRLGMPQGKAYTYGLLHDIGKIVLDQLVAESAPLFYRKALHGDRPLKDIEKELFGMDHTQVGALLVQHWNLPADMADVISGHHRSNLNGEHATPQDVALITVADFITNRFLAGSQLERLDPRPVIPALRRCGLSSEVLEKMIADMPLGLMRQQASGF
ncbi:HDOD domain-containing protein [Desulfosoma caldarium]|uniref:Putative nucleotidyltransferase with HDIG domain n=1 Tax=Desulfosoma caldarium TaxID=610254 RepID=A0A3N1VQ55_9BACT|nr:HDOD domain-containing protein [Desulfosoma caldarium]ROR03188.1 putative nucleotidyltransferase with HDIG domain [Desulfosoma caldarium]